MSESKDFPALRATKDRKPAYIRLGTIALLTAYWLLLFASTHLPSGAVSHPRVWDKLAHFVSYAGLAFLLASVVSFRGRPPLRIYAWLFLVAACYGAVDELAQNLVRGRTAELGDWVADMLGAIAGLAAHRLSLALVSSLFARPAALTDQHQPE